MFVSIHEENECVHEYKQNRRSTEIEIDVFINENNEKNGNNVRICFYFMLGIIN